MRVDRFGYKVEITDEAKRTLTVIGYQRKYGVRTLLECIEEFLSGLIVDGKLYSGERISSKFLGMTGRLSRRKPLMP
ncbi:hypothetical protein [Alistipes putredinis]|uniref:hypothetical protein n=1 Tax=Alistipes putredinis TaxID=28117 RepID=UPI003AB824F8